QARSGRVASVYRTESRAPDGQHVAGVGGAARGKDAGAVRGFGGGDEAVIGVSHDAGARAVRTYGEDPQVVREHAEVGGGTCLVVIRGGDGAHAGRRVRWQQRGDLRGRGVVHERLHGGAVYGDGYGGSAQARILKRLRIYRQGGRSEVDSLQHKD